ncbi:MAG: site-specific DNA-methyltransferase [Candidatus Sumerlaeaceae bacterium]|nr:site-specific DNA-methyltransferase [Candidatus Sumerlaeaceae bacterium]
MKKRKDSTGTPETHPAGPKKRGRPRKNVPEGGYPIAATPPPNPTDEWYAKIDADPVLTTAFTLRDDGEIEPTPESGSGVPPPVTVAPSGNANAPVGPNSELSTQNSELQLSPPVAPPRLAYRDEAAGIFLYHGNCLELLDAIAAKYPGGRFDCIFADPPYFLSNGGITCHAGRMVRVDKGHWDKSRGAELNHEFNLEWLRRCQRVLKPNGTIWVSGTHHVIFSIGYAMQQLGFKILNDIAWEKPNPPPNLSCRYFTHSTETVLWAARDEKSKHLFNYQEMRKITGKQMKTVWRMTSPGNAEKTFGKHPTQKPVALVERCILASTKEGDLVLDPFLGGGTTAVACVKTGRRAVAVDLDREYLILTRKRVTAECDAWFLAHFRVQTVVCFSDQNDLDPPTGAIHGSRPMSDDRTIDADCIFHETKFVFLSCTRVSGASVVHTTVDVDLREAWAHAPQGKQRETTHVVKCVTEILRVKKD